MTDNKNTKKPVSKKPVSKKTKKVTQKKKVTITPKERMQKDTINNDKDTTLLFVIIAFVFGCLLFVGLVLANRKVPTQPTKIPVIEENKVSPVIRVKKEKAVTKQDTIKAQTRKEAGYTKKDVGTSESILDKEGRVFYRNVMTDQYFTYLNEKDGYWLADETYVAKHFGDTFNFGTRTFYRYKGNYYEQLNSGIIKVTGEEFYKANYSNPPFIGKSNIISIPRFNGPQHITYVSPVGEYGYEVVGEGYITSKGTVISKGPIKEIK